MLLERFVRKMQIKWEEYVMSYEVSQKMIQPIL